MSPEWHGKGGKESPEEAKKDPKVSSDVSDMERHHVPPYEPDASSKENNLEHDERVQVSEEDREASAESLAQRQADHFPLGKEKGVIGTRWNVPDTSELDKAMKKRSRPGATEDDVK